MSTGMVGVMLGVSVFIGLLGLIAFIWGLRTGQFDDENKMMQGVLFDGEEDLNDKARVEQKKKEAEREARSSLKEENGS